MTKFQEFIQKWTSIYLGADMSEWNDVFNDMYAEYISITKTDSAFKEEYEKNNFLLSEILMQSVKKQLET